MDCDYDLKEIINGQNVIMSLKQEIQFINPKLFEQVILSKLF